MGDSTPFAIEVTGNISLGLRQELKQVSKVKKNNRVSLSLGYDAMPLHTNTNNGIGEIFEYQLVEKGGEELIMENSGLKTSYGIFGAPGSGKTVLLMHLLEQILAHEKNNPEKRYGALILDPKAALRPQITEMARKAGRLDDLVIINTNYLNELEIIDNKKQKKRTGYNVIDCSLDPYQLGAILVLAGRAAGISASDPFWFQEWSNLFSASLQILKIKQLADYIEDPGNASRFEPSITLRLLVTSIFNRDEKNTAEILNIARQLLAAATAIVTNAKNKQGPGRQENVQELEDLENSLDDLKLSLRQVERFYQQTYAATIESFIEKAFGFFQQSKYACYSDTDGKGNISFYDEMIAKGKIVLVSISPGEPSLAKTLCTLIKCLFQRTVLARNELPALKDCRRPLIIACDEYSEIASEVPGESMGDGQFLALAREYGCMAIFATQSVHVLQASSLKENWRSVFSTFAAKFYMRLVDNETAEEATKLAGQNDWSITSSGNSYAKDGSSSSVNKDFRERSNLPSIVLTHVLKTGEAVIIGSLDGGKTTPDTYFLKVPKPQ